MKYIENTEKLTTELTDSGEAMALLVKAGIKGVEMLPALGSKVASAVGTLGSVVASASERSSAMGTLISAGVPEALASRISIFLATTGTASIGTNVVAGVAGLWALSPVLTAVAGFLAAAVAALVVFRAVKGGMILIKKLIKTFTKAREEIPAEVTEAFDAEQEMAKVYEASRPRSPEEAVSRMDHHFERFQIALLKARRSERKMPRRAKGVIQQLSRLEKIASRDLDKLRQMVA